MCEWGTYEKVEVTIPPHLSHTNKERREMVEMRALNEGGVTTVASCCGHHKGLGSIMLGDGRELLIAANRTEAQHVEDLVHEHIEVLAGVEVGISGSGLDLLSAGLNRIIVLERAVEALYRKSRYLEGQLADAQAGRKEEQTELRRLQKAFAEKPKRQRKAK
jgi:hypothetical protein